MTKKGTEFTFQSRGDNYMVGGVARNSRFGFCDLPGNLRNELLLKVADDALEA